MGKYNIMLVDGSDASRKMIARFLQQADDINVTGCAEISEALIELEVGKYDLVSTALRLPDGDGIGLTRRLRALDNYGAVPVVLVSGDACDALLKNNHDIGVTACFDKSKGVKPLVQFLIDSLHGVSQPSENPLPSDSAGPEVEDEAQDTALEDTAAFEVAAAEPLVEPIAEVPAGPQAGPASPELELVAMDADEVSVVTETASQEQADPQHNPSTEAKAKPAVDADRELLQIGDTAPAVTSGDDSEFGPEPLPQDLPPRVLYIEDSATAALAMRMTLEEYGIDVTHLTAAEDALEQLKKRLPDQENGFDLVVTDLHLSGRMHGEGLIFEIRQSLGLSLNELPILVVTTSGHSESSYAKLIAKGANDYFTKPVIEEILMARVNVWIAMKKFYYLHKKQKLM